MTPRISKINANACTVTVNGATYYFSYETCIAFKGHLSGLPIRNDNPSVHKAVRIANAWGPTTGRHFNQLGCADFELVTDEEFLDILGST
jgi:hypothetical protein